MDISQILNGIKGKVLDAVNFELLKGAYELQNQNIEQLKNNNEAIKESVGLLKEKIDRMDLENKRLTALINSHSSNNSKIELKISAAAKDILIKCIKEDITTFNDEQITHSLRYSKVQLESAVDELSESDLISQSSVMDYGTGTDWSLTSRGKKIALELAGT